MVKQPYLQNLFCFSLVGLEKKMSKCDIGGKGAQKKKKKLEYILFKLEHNF